MDLANIMYRREYTGKPGRPKNSGARDFESLYEICRLLAADSSLTKADAIRRVVDTTKDYNAVDRLTRKLSRSPRMLENAKNYRERAVERFVKNSRIETLTLRLIGFRNRRAVFDYLVVSTLAPPGIWNDTRVVDAIDKVWRSVRPCLAMEAVWEAQGVMDLVAPPDNRCILHERWPH